MYLFPAHGTTVDLSQFLYVKMYKLHITSMSSESSLVTANSEFDLCPSLTHMSINGRVSIDQSAMLAISKAVRDGKLPSLDSFSLAGANIRGQLKHLFDEHTEWPVLSHLNLQNSELDRQDLRDLFTDANGLLTKLASLELSDSHCYHSPDEDISSTQHWTNLTTLSLKSLTKSGFSKVTEGIRQSMLVNLRKLFLCMGDTEMCRLEDIEPNKVPLIEDLSLQRCIVSEVNLKHLSNLASHWKLCRLDISYSRGIDEHLSALTSSPDLKSLKSLVLRNCNLGEQTLDSLEKASVEGRLSNLENLDLSENPDLISCIDEISSRWNNLQRLRIDHQTNISLTKNGFDVLQPLLEKDCIPSVRELRFNAHGTETSGFSEIVHFMSLSLVRMRHLKRLDFVTSTAVENLMVMMSLIETIGREAMPALETVCFISERKTVSENENYKQKVQTLRSLGVIVHTTDPAHERFLVDVIARVKIHWFDSSITKQKEKGSSSELVSVFQVWR